MTQTTVGRLAPDGAPSPAAVPRQRTPGYESPDEGPVRLLDLPSVVAAPVAPVDRPEAALGPAVEIAVPRAPSHRRSLLRGALAVDAAIASVAATAWTALELLPVTVACVAVVLWPSLLASAGRYRLRRFDETRPRRAVVVAGTGLRTAVVALAAAPWVTAVDLFAVAALVVGCGFASSLHHLAASHQARPRLVLAGRRGDVRRALTELGTSDTHEIVAVCLIRASTSPVDDVPTYVGLDSAVSAAEHHHADAVVVLPGARLAPEEVRRLQWSLAKVGADLCVDTGLLDVTPTRTRVFASGGLTLVRAASPALGGPRRLVKTAVERTAAALGLIVLLPGLAVVGVLVRLDSPGAAIYRQRRVGRDGRLFTMYKFRSMTDTAQDQRTELVDSNEADGVLFKIRQDPRITRLGRWLRRCSIDELPQLWNVVRGDMSLVGPRPALPEEVARYDIDPRRRLVVRPGMTGLWQISGRSDLSWSESVRLDVRYVDNWSLGLDVAILLRTVRAVLDRRGAY